jgi:hypothetical protein
VKLCLLTEIDFADAVEDQHMLDYRQRSFNPLVLQVDDSLHIYIRKISDQEHAK